MWACPNCERQFKNANQSHSCVKIDLDYHFQNKPEILRKIYDRLVEGMKTVGEYGIDVVKNCILFKLESHFAAVYPMKNFLRVGFSLDRSLSSPRIEKERNLSPVRIFSTVKLTCPEDVDDELIGWLKEAMWHIASK